MMTGIEHYLAMALMLIGFGTAAALLGRASVVAVHRRGGSRCRVALPGQGL